MDIPQIDALTHHNQKHRTWRCLSTLWQPQRVLPLPPASMRNLQKHLPCTKASPSRENKKTHTHISYSTLWRPSDYLGWTCCGFHHLAFRDTSHHPNLPRLYLCARQTSLFSLFLRPARSNDRLCTRKSPTSRPSYHPCRCRMWDTIWPRGRDHYTPIF